MRRLARLVFFADAVIGICTRENTTLGFLRKYLLLAEYGANRYYEEMIAHIRGTVLGIEDNAAIIEAGGIGHRTFTTPEILSSAVEGGELTLWTHLVVREDALDLYGFPTRDEVAFFRQLISISGVGPRSALGILGMERFEVLVQAISRGDTTYLTKVSGIGKKSAEKIVLELKDKVTPATTGGSHGESSHLDVLEALVALGYKKEEAREALKSATSKGSTEKDTLKAALAYLSQQA